MEEQYLTTGELAELLGVARWKLAYWIERGQLPPPSASVPGRRLFSREDVKKIRTKLRQLSDEDADQTLTKGGAPDDHNAWN